MLVRDSDVTLLLEGKAEVVEGYAEVFGCPVKEIEAKNLTPLYLREGAVKIEGKYIPVKGSTIPESWEKVVEEIKSSGWRKILLFGETDTGKSSFAVWLVNKLDGKTCVIDADIGQADIGHPAAMGIGIAEKCASLSEIPMLDGFFVGSTSPMGREARCLRGFAKLAAVAKEINADWIIVDTTGWTRGRKARNYKLAKIEIFRPDVIVCLGEIPYYLEEFNTITVETFVPKKRSRELRGAIRSERYARWLEGANVVSLSVKDVKLRNTTLFKGRRVSDDFIREILDTVLFAETGPDFLNVCVLEEGELGVEALKALREVYGVEDVSIFTPKSFEDLVVGVYSDNKYEGLGLLKRIDFDSGKIDILTRAKSIRAIEFGEFRLEKGREVLARVP
ncbi:Clp1/GlmU family protein [Archaeoglobus veneficus]|uniref:polynucleotide 5'-hydroxyl-kinase n=1 Tax=Archaeoglobus veneficus (strain DSM 11195 / SNP6) TaxID=693661 RepID=F2KNN8_ARCVS|nr:Clp1/GlmU family protein [Archaeoglobus veneficus]AEA46266.1 Polynucleotide 5'-hydroxyl-kinase [Archaeoglobus veneficus SNP6]